MSALNARNWRGHPVLGIESAIDLLLQISNTATLSTSYGVPLMVYVSVTNATGSTRVYNSSQRLTAVVGTSGGDVIHILGRNFGPLASKINVTWDGLPVSRADLVSPHYELDVYSLPGESCFPYTLKSLQEIYKSTGCPKVDQ